MWLSFFQGALERPPHGLLNSSTAAVLLTSASSRRFALTFGHGRHLLKPGSYEVVFGLRVTLNAIDPDRIRSVDRKTFDVMSKHTKTQASREGSVPDFGFDVEQDLLRAVTGTPVDQKLGKRLTGLDALVTSVALRLEDVPAQLDRYQRQFHDEAYRTRFPWVDQVSELKDPTRRQQLDSELVEMLNTGRFDCTWLSVPDIIEWAEVMGFRYGKRVRADVHPDLHIRTFLAEVGSPIGLEQLLATHIFSINAAGEYVSGKWRAYDCLYCEIDSGDTTYLLNGGKWYAIRNDFVEEVNASVEAIPACSLPLPPYQDASEGQYARRIFGSDTEQFALMDGENIPYGGGASKVEFCDLYTHRRHLIHLFTPLHASWVNQIECWFSLLARRVLRHGNFTSAGALGAAVAAFIRRWNNHKRHPFRWTFTGYPLQTGLAA